MIVELRLDPDDRHVACLPDELSWYYDEPIWQAIAEGRLNHGLENFSLSVQYDDDHAIDKRLEAKLAGMRLEIGGKLREFTRTLWMIDDTFRTLGEARRSA